MSTCTQKSMIFHFFSIVQDSRAPLDLVMLLFDSNITSAYTEEVILLSRAIRKPGFRRVFAYAKTKAQISCAVTAKLISAFVFATRIVQPLFCLNPKFQASSFFCDCTDRFVSDKVGNPENRFSRVAAHLIPPPSV